LRVDIVNRIKGVSVSEIIKRAVKYKIQDTKMLVVALPDLIKLKKLAGRPQDIADIEKLKKISKKR
jgi:predicted nucleotidyltransferase